MGSKLIFSFCFLLLSRPLSSKPLPQEEATTFNPDSLVLSFEDLIAINNANSDDEDGEHTTTALELLLKFEGMFFGTCTVFLFVIWVEIDTRASQNLRSQPF